MLGQNHYFFQKKKCINWRTSSPPFSWTSSTPYSLFQFWNKHILVSKLGKCEQNHLVVWAWIVHVFNDQNCTFFQNFRVRYSFCPLLFLNSGVLLKFWGKYFNPRWLPFSNHEVNPASYDVSSGLQCPQRSSPPPPAPSRPQNTKKKK